MSTGKVDIQYYKDGLYWYVVYPAKKFIGTFKKKSNMDHFLMTARNTGLVVEEVKANPKRGFFRRNPMTPGDVSAWLEAAYHEEKHGIQEYEKLLRHLKGYPEYSRERNMLKKIVRDERRHLKMLENYVQR